MAQAPKELPETRYGPSKAPELLVQIPDWQDSVLPIESRAMAPVVHPPVPATATLFKICLLYTSDAADE